MTFSEHERRQQQARRERNEARRRDEVMTAARLQTYGNPFGNAILRQIERVLAADDSFIAEDVEAVVAEKADEYRETGATPAPVADATRDEPAVEAQDEVTAFELDIEVPA